MQICSTPLVIREMQIKFKIRYHLALTGMTNQKETIASINENEEKLELSYIFGWECKMVQPCWENSLRFLKMLSMELS